MVVIEPPAIFLRDAMVRQSTAQLILSMHLREHLADQALEIVISQRSALVQASSVQITPSVQLRQNVFLTPLVLTERYVTFITSALVAQPHVLLVRVLVPQHAGLTFTDAADPMAQEESMKTLMWL